MNDFLMTVIKDFFGMFSTDISKNKSKIRSNEDALIETYETTQERMNATDDAILELYELISGSEE